MRSRFSLLAGMLAVVSFARSPSGVGALRAGAQRPLARAAPRLAMSSSAGPAAKPLVTGAEALELSARGGVALLDASWHLDRTRDAHAEFVDEHARGARFFDIEAISDRRSPLPHMLPSEADFARMVSDLGVGKDDHVLVYTVPNCFSAARCWWMFKTFSHEKVSIINGGLGAWKAAGGAVESGAPAPRSSRPPKGLVQDGGNTYLLDKYGFQAKLHHSRVRTWRQVLDTVEHKTQEVILDARSPQRFNGEVDEPRPGLRRGHMPGAVNLPFGLLLEEDQSRFRSVEEMQEVFRGVLAKQQQELDSRNLRVATTCGSGVTAAVLSFGLQLCGAALEDAPVYDGSWAEWGQEERTDLPVVLGKE